MSQLRIIILGTSAAQPTIDRGLSALSLRYDGQHFLFDCGEGTQRQMIRFGTGFDLAGIFFTHFHADHYLGAIGLLRTLSMHGRVEPLPVYGPAPAVAILTRTLFAGIETLGFDVPIIELSPRDTVRIAGARVVAIPTEHRTPSLGYAFVEEPKPGLFHPERATALGVPAGPEFGRLQRGETVVISGHSVTPAQVMDEPRRGRKVVISGDTRPCDAFLEASRDADLMIHEATFADAAQARALETMHATATEAATIAKAAGAKRLVLTHLSSRYADPAILEEEARRVFAETVVAADGLSIEL